MFVDKTIYELMKEEEEQKKMFEDQLKDPVIYELEVNNSLIKCSKRVLESSSLLQDMLDLTDPRDNSPFPIPSFISKQIILDWVEMVEKEDIECAHLVLVSLSYLIDFLIAMDFLCCDKLKSGVEEKIKEKIDETNWREVLAYSERIIGLGNTTKAALEKTIIKSVDKYYRDSSHAMNEDHEDPWVGDYSNLSANVIKLVLRSLNLIYEKTKVHIIRNWVARNGFLSHQDVVFEMLRCINLKELLVSMKEVTTMVYKWPMTDEQLSIFSSMVDEAYEARRQEQEENENQRKKSLLCTLIERGAYKCHRILKTMGFPRTFHNGEHVDFDAYQLPPNLEGPSDDGGAENYFDYLLLRGAF